MKADPRIAAVNSRGYLRSTCAQLCLALVLVSAAGLTEAAFNVAAAQEAADERTTRKTPAMRETVYKKLSEAQTLNEEGKTQEALRTLEALSKQGDLNSYEVAQVYSFYGYIYFSQERYQDSLRAYETVLKQSDLPEAMEISTVYTLAQLNFAVERYDQAVAMLNRWFKLATNPGPDPYVLLGQAYYSLNQYQQAVSPIEKAIALAREQGREISENWWLLLRVCYFELGNYPKVVEILEELVKHSQKKEYWTQLSSMYAELGEERKQLLAYEMAYIQGFLDRSQELVTMAQLYMQADVPWRGAKVLEKGLASGVVEKNAQNYRLLAQAYQMAQEDKKSIAPLVEAARLSDDGELYVRLAQAYVNLDRWEEAAEAARQGLSKGGLRRSDSANVLLGMALFNLKRYEQAKAAFRVAQGDSRSNRMAAQWIAYIGKEQEREAELARALE